LREAHFWMLKLFSAGLALQVVLIFIKFATL
jgi:hypothetical protein